MKKSRIYKCIVVEDETLIRKNLIKKINSLNLPIEVAGEATNGGDAIQLVERLYPDLVLSDIKMPNFSGLELAKYIHSNHPNIYVAIISCYNEFSYAQEAIKYSVMDYILKPVKMDELKEFFHKFLIHMDANEQTLDSYKIQSSELDKEELCNLIEHFIQDNYKKDISMQELSDKFGFTPEYLSKIFKKRNGDTITKYLTKIRMNEAKRILIQSEDMEIQKVAELVGYKDSFYFSRVFKNHEGVYPSDFRKSAKGSSSTL